MKSNRWLAALPVFNEVDHVLEVLENVRLHAQDILVVDDGSTDGTSEILAKQHDIQTIRHDGNQGYGAALKTAFQYTIDEGYTGVVTLDCDGQHQPKRIPRFIQAARSADIVSGSRYLKQYEGDSVPPAERLFINRRITAEINRRLGYRLTDAFCGFKAYRSEGLECLDITDDGYAMPLELWVQAAAAGLCVIEIPVPLLYLDLNRSFGGSLDHAETRLAYYNQVMDNAFERLGEQGLRNLQTRELCHNARG